jgi:hypothetical protein
VSATTPPKSAVDYEALAAKYATPAAMPLNQVSPQEHSNSDPARQKLVKPSTTTYGVVNAGATASTAKDTVKEEKGSKTKLLLVIVGLIAFFIIYAVIWVIIFGVELPFAQPA